MAKQPAPKKPLAGPPNRHHGHYYDQCGARFYVPATPDFALFRCDSLGQPTHPDSPLHRSEAEFTGALSFGTFQKIIA